MTTCRSCGAPIRWLRTEAGKPMPVDETPSPDGNVVLIGGFAHVLHKDEEPPENAARLLPHFATCPNYKR